MDHTNETLQNLRVRYLSKSLDIADCDPDPVKQFKNWFDESVQSKCDEPNAFILSTVKGDQPRARTVLLKGIVEDKFVFYTNYQSAKGDELEMNQKVCMTFLWLPLQRQVRIEGVITKMPVEDSENYFKKRPRGSQLGAVASPQSKKVAGREELEKLFRDAEEKFKNDQHIPRPLHWGGYGITPTYLEFWQGRDNRMHDRVIYDHTKGSWDRYRLAP